MIRGEELNKKDRAMILGIAVLFFFGMLLVGKGFTGMYLIDVPSEPLDLPQEACETNDHCESDQVCCMFYKENYGVCEKQDNCKAIAQVTKEYKQQITTAPELAEGYKFTEQDKLSVTKQISLSHLEKPSSKNDYASLITGAILLAMGAVWIFYLKKSK